MRRFLAAKETHQLRLKSYAPWLCVYHWDLTQALQDQGAGGTGTSLSGFATTENGAGYQESVERTLRVCGRYTWNFFEKAGKIAPADLIQMD